MSTGSPTSPEFMHFPCQLNKLMGLVKPENADLKPELEGAALVALLFITAFALGVEFGGSGIAGAFGGGGTPSGSGGEGSAHFPKLVLHAQGVNPSDLYASGAYDVIPPRMFAPLMGVHAEFVATGAISPFYTGRVITITLITNSSGLAASNFPEGNYNVTISGPSYRVNTTVQLMLDTTTTLGFTLSPSAEDVTILKVVSPDTVAGVEPTSMLYALLNYSSPPTSGFSELAGFEPASPGTVIGVTYSASGNSTSGQNPSQNATGPIYGGAPVLLNATLVGSYRGAQGYWAALAPLQVYPSYPLVDVKLFQFEPTIEVNYTVG